MLAQTVQLIMVTIITLHMAGGKRIVVLLHHCLI